MSLSGLRTPTLSSPGSVSLSHVLSPGNTNTYVSGCISCWLRPEFHSWQSSSGSVELAGVCIHLPFATARHNWKTRQTRAPRKQLGAPCSRAACRNGHTFGTHKEDPFKTTSSALFSTGLTAPILCWTAWFHFTTSVCRPSARVWVSAVLLSLAQRC